MQVALGADPLPEKLPVLLGALDLKMHRVGLVLQECMDVRVHCFNIVGAHFHRLGFRAHEYGIAVSGYDALLYVPSFVEAASGRFAVPSEMNVESIGSEGVVEPSENPGEAIVRFDMVGRICQPGIADQLRFALVPDAIVEDVRGGPAECQRAGSTRTEYEYVHPLS